MPSHKFHVGQLVNYRPTGRIQDAPRGTYEVTGRLPERGGEFEYRIKHFSEEHERTARESELQGL
jgi:hypothetical protein